MQLSSLNEKFAGQLNVFFLVILTKKNCVLYNLIKNQKHQFYEK